MYEKKSKKQKMELRGFEPLRSTHGSALAYILSAGR